MSLELLHRQHDVQLGSSLILHGCSGATWGSILGTLAGSNQLTSPLVEPLNHNIKPLVFGFQEVTMAELAGAHSGLVKTLKGAFVKNHDQ